MHERMMGASFAARRAAPCVLCVAVYFLVGLARAQENPIESLPARLVQEAAFQREGQGIRICPTSPDCAEGSMRYQNHWLLEFPLALSGSFEAAASFHVNQMGKADCPLASACNAEMILQTRDIEGHYGISIAFDPQLGSDPSCFKVSRAEPCPEGLHFQILSFPRKSKEGRVVIRRAGSQLVFLAADGRDAALKELVRFPYDSRVEPCLGLAAFQGNGTDPMPVDVNLWKIEVKAEKVLKGPQLQKAFVAKIDVGDYPGMVDYRNQPGQLLGDTDRSTVNRGEGFHLEGSDLRVCPPVCPGDLKGASSFWARDWKYGVQGDFELSTDFHVRAMGPPAPDGEAPVGVFLGMETAGPLGSIYFGRGCAKSHGPARHGQGYMIKRTFPAAASLGADGNIDPSVVHETIHFPKRAVRGKLILRRVGEEIHFLVEEEKGEEKILYKTFAITDPAMKLRIIADQGGSPSTAIDVNLSRIILKANVLVHEGKKVPLIPSIVDELKPIQSIDRKEEPPLRLWLYATVSAGALAGLLSGSVVACRRVAI